MVIDTNDSSHDPPTEVDEDGTMRWLNEDYDLHHVGKPAIERTDGYKAWYVNGELHNPHGHAVEHPDGTKEWWIHGQRHRDLDPAVEASDGSKAWFRHGELYQVQDPHGRVFLVSHGETMPDPTKQYSKECL